MRIPEKYYYVVITIIFFAIALGIAGVWYFKLRGVHATMLRSLPKLVKNTPLDVPSTTQKPTKQLTFTDKNLYITLAYPENLQIRKLSNQLVAITNGKNQSEDDSELIYSQAVIKPTADVAVPFKIDGEITQTIKININNFNARLVTFKSGTKTSQVFFLRSNTHVIVVRPPVTAALDPETVYNIVSSIHEIE